jgi:hypothetical protein
MVSRKKMRSFTGAEAASALAFHLSGAASDGADVLLTSICIRGTLVGKTLKLHASAEWHSGADPAKPWWPNRAVEWDAYSELVFDENASLPVAMRALGDAIWRLSLDHADILPGQLPLF